jgi:hypothetical protein
MIRKLPFLPTSETLRFINRLSDYLIAAVVENVSFLAHFGEFSREKRVKNGAFRVHFGACFSAI